MASFPSQAPLRSAAIARGRGRRGPCAIDIPSQTFTMTSFVSPPLSPRRTGRTPVASQARSGVPAALGPCCLLPLQRRLPQLLASRPMATPTWEELLGRR